MAKPENHPDSDPIRDHSVPADADFSAAGSDEASPGDSTRPDRSPDTSRDARGQRTD